MSDFECNRMLKYITVTHNLKQHQQQRTAWESNLWFGTINVNRRPVTVAERSKADADAGTGGSNPTLGLDV
jgi:hypothetical protein